MPKQTIIDQAKARWKQWVEAEHAQVDRERADLAFYEGEGVWPSDIKRAREGRNDQSGGRPPIPARPCLTINKQRMPVAHVVNGIRQTEFGIEIVPADDFAQQGGPIDHSEIELRENLVRRIQRESDAMDARMWAADRAVKAGRGYYGIMTKYAPGKTMDQEIYYRRFYDQSSVALDPAHEAPDGSDAAWAFVTTKMRWAEFEGQYPKAAADYGEPSDAFSGWDELVKDFPDWYEMADDGVTRIVLVREHWYKQDDSKTLYTLQDGTLAYGDELPDGFDTNGLESRRVSLPRVKWCKVDGQHVLEETEWASPWIPILKVLYEEIQPFDSERRAEGMIRPMREPVFGESVMVSSLVETIGLAPKTPVIGAAGQFEGFEDAWDAANVRNIPRLEYNVTTEGAPGQALPPPTRMPGPAPETINAISGSIQMFDEFIKSTSGVPDPTLGNVDPSIRSGKAIKTLLDQAKMGTSSGLDNLIVTMKHEGRVVNSLLEPIYGRRPGRLVRLMTGERNPMPAIIGTKDQPAPFVVVGDGKNKTAQPFDPRNPQHQGQEPKRYVLTPDADWNVAVKVSKNYDTRREAQNAQITDLVNAAPEQMLPVMGDKMFEYDDGPASPEIAKRMKYILLPAIQQAENGNQPLPPEVQAQMAQSQQAMQLMQQELQKLQQVVQAKQIEGQVKLQETQMELQSKEKIALMQVSAQLATAQSKIDAEDARTFVDAVENRIAKQLELHMQQLGHAHEQIMQARDHMAQAAMMPPSNGQPEGEA